ncbi:hypothetical protein JJE66_36355 [Bradyrhizobium diazoefficiens]|uniref:hypothetical protein n=1 Tax=Bradyrhizobium diazoefficiens TaxID=1355477 RepID=UPI00190A137C|nr:hypothetical protein [Bradyrhizobium diazoefficiens]MBK3666669.1 hypothetical protein [Bradyrhizobium diazoefficiens]
MFEAKDYRVCCHHFVTPTDRVVYPAQEPLLTYSDALRHVQAEREKGHMVAWVIDRAGACATR